MKESNEGLILCLVMTGLLAVGSFHGGLQVIGALWLATFCLLIAWGCVRHYAVKLHRSEPYPSYDKEKEFRYTNYYRDYVNGWATSSRVDRMYLESDMLKLLSIASACAAVMTYFFTS